MKLLVCTLVFSTFLAQGLKRNHEYQKSRWWLDIAKPNRTRASTETTRTRPPPSSTPKVEVTTPQIFSLYRQVDSKRLKQSKQKTQTRKPPTVSSKPPFDIYYPEDLKQLQAKPEITTATPYAATKRIKPKTSTSAHVATTSRTVQGRTSPIQTESLQTTTPLPGESKVDKNFAKKCQCGCWPLTTGQESSLQQVASDLQADAFFTLVTFNEDIISSLFGVDEIISGTYNSRPMVFIVRSRTSSSYTFFLPNNEAFCHLSLDTIDRWRQDKKLLQTIVRNHVVVGGMPLDELQKGGLLGSNLPNGNLRVNNNDNETLTINGGRMVYADLVGPKNGVVHIIDRVLYPIGDRNLLQTIKDCNKFDGFLSLIKHAELNDILTDVGPYTIFLPTNDALAKMPKDEYSIYKSNKTALKEFLLYHMVFGAYFSSDLKDGHYLETGQQSASIRVSIRVDGCQRRLVEVNASPVYLTDIPASNGVIHILDWVLSPFDLNWCINSSP